jgi:hypothetical protein
MSASVYQCQLDDNWPSRSPKNGWRRRLVARKPGGLHAEAEILEAEATLHLYSGQSDGTTEIGQVI